MCHKEFFVGKIFEKCNACKKDLVSENCHDNMSHVFRYIFVSAYKNIHLYVYSFSLHVLFNAQCLYSTQLQLL